MDLMMNHQCQQFPNQVFESYPGSEEVWFTLVVMNQLDDEWSNWHNFAVL